jgi:hypothetical protein
MDEKRANYWNEDYAKYWQARVSESNERSEEHTSELQSPPV